MFWMWYTCIVNKYALWFQEELVDSIQKKMDKLKEEKKELTKELEETETLGKEVQRRSFISYLKNDIQERNHVLAYKTYWEKME